MTAELSLRRNVMLIAVATIASVVLGIALHARADEPDQRLPDDYRNWRLVSVAHEAGPLNDIRAILANDVAIDAFRRGQRPFPDGAILARLAYRYVSSEQNNAVFGQQQSFVAGEPTNVQVSVRDSRRFASTGGWGFAQFRDGRLDPAAQTPATCFACHDRLPRDRDRVFTDLAP